MHTSPDLIPRLRRLFAFAGVALILAVTACSSDDSASSAAGSPAPDGPFPVSIEHTYGTTTITRKPERVVTVGLTDPDAVLALGVVPIGIVEWFVHQPGNVMPWSLAKLGDAEPPKVVGGPDGTNFEAIAALEPDLILGVYADLSQGDYDKLSQIAPTIAQPKDQPAYGVAWDDQTRIIGRALGEEAAASDLVEDVEDQVAAAAAAHPEFVGKTGVVATYWSGSIVVYSAEDNRGRFLESLGFVQPPEIAKLVGDDFSADLSLEQTSLLDVDAIVWIINDRETAVAGS